MDKAKRKPQIIFTRAVNEEFLDQIGALKRRYAIDSSAAVIRFLVNEETKRNEDENTEIPSRTA